MNDKRYISTSIPYVNAAPHVGFALELVQADVLARHARLSGCDVLFQGGTDDNSLKNVRAAETAGVRVEDLVTRNAQRFADLAGALDVRFDEFVSTGTDFRHRSAVEKLWQACHEAGDLYRRPYEGLYCVGCEQYYGQDELADGCCPEHGTPPELVRENNWFFRLSRYGARLVELIETRELDIQPDSKRNEVLAFLKGGLEDLCVSRTVERAKGWGIGVPGDDGEVVYVWFDALANYLTGAGYGTDDAAFRQNWTDAATREHVVGKGITRFHAVYWPAILLSAGIELPTRVLVHGYLTVEGRKIGKSSGNGIDPFSLAEAYGSDALRWYLLRHVRTTEDADFSEYRLVTAHDADLADQIGNLVSRTAAVLTKAGRGVPAHPGKRSEFGELGATVRKTVDGALERFALHEATNAIISYVGEANRYIVQEAPWSLVKRIDEKGVQEAFNRVASELFECFGVVADCLAPFLPSASQRLTTSLGLIEAGHAVPRLFPKIVQFHAES